MRAVRKVLESLECASKETWILFNKWDNVPESRIVEARDLEAKLLPEERPFRISAVTGLGLEELAGAVRERLHREDREIEVLIPHDRGDVIAYIRENGTLIATEYINEGVKIRAAISPARYGKLRSLLPSAFPLIDET
jgi:GTP-binding protein HflX